jgi:hypothetical protein
LGLPLLLLGLPGGDGAAMLDDASAGWKSRDADADAERRCRLDVGELAPPSILSLAPPPLPPPPPIPPKPVRTPAPPLPPLISRGIHEEAEAEMAEVVPPAAAAAATVAINADIELSDDISAAPV